MSNMEEILFWVQTKQAPCLMNFDNVIKKQYEEIYSSSRPISAHSSCEEVNSPKKKKKRKLSELDDSASPEKQKNLFFESPEQNKKAVISICRSDTMDSDIDFNIKKSSVQLKSKRMRLQKNCRTALHKKNKVFTSTPKVTTALRRSGRRTQHINYTTEVNISFPPAPMYTPMNDNQKPYNKQSNEKFKSPDVIVNGNSALNHVKQATTFDTKPVINQAVLNGQFEDLSDVSGFTANYIRSTKLHPTKTPGKLRNKGSRNLAKQSRQRTKQDDIVVIRLNKAINTSKGNNPALNCSADSSQNILNYTTLRSKKNTVKKVDTNTSSLKFIEPRAQKKIDIDEVNNRINKQINSVKVNIPIRPRNTSRYPKRQKSASNDLNATDTSTDQSPDKRRSLNVKHSTMNNSERKENPDDSISRTRSGRPIGLHLREPSNSVLVINNTTEESTVTVNVAVATEKEKLTSSGNSKKCRSSSGVKYVQRVADSSVPAQRDRSGFAQCFSDSDNDSEPHKHRKFFC